MSRCSSWPATFGSTAQTANSAAWYAVLGWCCLLVADLGDELEHGTNQSIIQLILPSSDRQFV